MFQKTKNHTLLTIICASILVTAATPIKAWDWRHTVATGVGIAAIGGALLYNAFCKKVRNNKKKMENDIKQMENDIKRAQHFVEKLITDQKNFIAHNEMILKNSKEPTIEGPNEAPAIWQKFTKENGVTILFYFYLPQDQLSPNNYEIVAVSSGLIQFIIAHHVINNTFKILDITPNEFIALLEKLNTEQQATHQHAKPA